MLGKDGHGGAENNYQNSLVVKNVGFEGSIEKCEKKTPLWKLTGGMHYCHLYEWCSTRWQCSW